MDLRKTKEELDSAVPVHNLLDVSASKSKAQLAHRGTLGQRHRPSSDALKRSILKRAPSTASNFSSNASFHTVRLLHRLDHNGVHIECMFILLLAISTSLHYVN